MPGSNIPTNNSVIAQNLKLNYEYTMQIMTSVETASGTGTFSPLAKGFDNITEAMNEVVSQFSFLSDEGWGSSYVTGAQPTYTLTGYRVTGDAAQDFIFGNDVLYGFGKARETTMIITSPDGTHIEVPVTLAGISRSGGAANAPTAISVTIHFRGKPKITTATTVSET